MKQGYIYIYMHKTSLIVENSSSKLQARKLTILRLRNTFTYIYLSLALFYFINRMFD